MSRILDFDDGFVTTIPSSVTAMPGTDVSNTPSGNLAATNMQTAVNELQSDIDTRAPISTTVTLTGTQTLTNKTLTSPLGIVKADVSGIGSVDNTSDVNKPVSTAQAAAIALKMTSPMTTDGDIIYGGASGVPTRLANGTSGQFLKSNGTTLAPTWSSIAGSTLPTRQIFLSGSGTYTTPASVRYLVVRMVGGGGGSSGSGTASGGTGGTGGNSTFGSSLLTVNGGGGGIFASNGSAGGTVTISAPAIDLGTSIVGQQGQGGGGSGATSAIAGGYGGSTLFGGGGGGGWGLSTATTPAVNTGAGAGGGGAQNISGGVSGTGGSAGGFIVAQINTPSATYAYAVGAGGTAGTAGTSGVAGASGSSGKIVVEEYY